MRVSWYITMYPNYSVAMNREVKKLFSRGICSKGVFSGAVYGGLKRYGDSRFVCLSLAAAGLTFF
jgi:hypothetical protein